MNEICGIYQNAKPSSQKGVHIISTDEMTGIQALEHKYPDKSPLSGQCAKVEFEYIRHDITSLISFFDVVSGCMKNPTQMEEDFVKTVEALVNTDPGASWTFVCDGLNIHKSESLVRFVSKMCGIDTPLRQKRKSGILKSMKSRVDFPHDFLHRIQFVYTPKHSS